MKYLILIISFLFTGVAQAEVASVGSIASGKAANGEYIIPKKMAQECDLKLQDTEQAAEDVKTCILRLLKEKFETQEGSVAGKKLFNEMLAQDKLEFFKTMVAEGVYSSDYEETVVKEFEKSSSGEASSMLGGLGGAGGSTLGLNPSESKAGSEGNENGAANIREDIAVLEEADYNFATALNSHLNKILATQIMHTALTYIRNYDSDYVAGMEEGDDE